MNSLYAFLETNDLYVVLLITLIIWIGIVLYLNRIEKKLKDLEKKGSN
ncbi:MAG TPA: CcmD family protein [Bacteroidetes bacterium]|nr:CcmD family protein [Ignavibacteria bacterium]HCA42517.1 CcmD family protein [Bacteroidota bacterium]HCN37996.1 CcmD family protein [Bacteroidota bacterium]